MKSWTQKLQGAEFRILRLQEVPLPVGTGPVDNPEACAEYLRQRLVNSQLYNPDVENFMGLYVNTRRRPIGFVLLSHGTLDTILVHPREVFKAAIVLNAAAVIVSHTHPSGDPTPSEADIKVTRDLIRAGQLLKIELLDHIVLGQASEQNARGYCSLRELGYFY